MSLPQYFVAREAEEPRCYWVVEENNAHPTPNKKIVTQDHQEYYGIICCGVKEGDMEWGNTMVQILNTAAEVGGKLKCSRNKEHGT